MKYYIIVAFIILLVACKEKEENWAGITDEVKIVHHDQTLSYDSKKLIFLIDHQRFAYLNLEDNRISPINIEEPEDFYIFSKNIIQACPYDFDKVLIQMVGVYKENEEIRAYSLSMAGELELLVRDSINGKKITKIIGWLPGSKEGNDSIMIRTEYSSNVVYVPQNNTIAPAFEGAPGRYSYDGKYYLADKEYYPKPTSLILNNKEIKLKTEEYFDVNRISWSPDGEKILLNVNGDAFFRKAILINTKDMIEHPESVPFKLLEMPSVYNNPDFGGEFINNSSIAISANRGHGVFYLYLWEMDLKGRILRQLTK